MDRRAACPVLGLRRRTRPGSAPDVPRHGLPRTTPWRSLRPARRRGPPGQERGDDQQPDRHPRPDHETETPKSDAGNRDLVLDDDTVKVLTAYKARRAAWKLAAGADWPDTGLFFVRPDGRAWHPNLVTQRFRRLLRKAGLPPIRPHDLRHGAATMALDAGIDIKVVSEQLGHSTTTLTLDTYTSVVKRLHHEAANAVANKIKQRRDKTA
ncbi:tyrosine-type recombinase/integrase [Phytohabitans flavus]|uniref:tyrosine-type recombinase/integrase n=1 Tax=Phytohabitans flavus TaxID=1076124 RepID=UPI001E2895AD|nr:tyrosine-type recombinase/integrase [Phytohabitans flavus]